MMSQTLQLATALNKENAAQLTRALQAIQGFTSVAFAPTLNRIHLTFDEDRTSLQELVMVVGRAGYKVDQAERRTESGCCGGCCS